MDSKWVLVDIWRSEGNTECNEWWMARVEVKKNKFVTVWRNVYSSIYQSSEYSYFVECRDRKYDTAGDAMKAARRIFS